MVPFSGIGWTRREKTRPNYLERSIIPRGVLTQPTDLRAFSTLRSTGKFNKELSDAA